MVRPASAAGDTSTPGGFAFQHYRSTNQLTRRRETPAVLISGPAMSKRRALLYILSVFLFILAALDFSLYWIDPFGVTSYFYDYNALQSYSLPALDGQRYIPGHYHFRKYSVTIGLDGFRVVPTSRGGACQIVVLGDSVAFGMGSDISFVDVLAPDIPATVINSGVPGYSVANIAAVIDSVPSDGYIYLIIQNDDEPFRRWQLPSGSMPAATSLYLSWLFPVIPPEHNTPRFVEYARPVLAREDVLSFAFEGDALTEAAQALGAIVIPNYTHTVSRFDAHPNEEGSKEIADSMRDAVLAFLFHKCPG